MSTHEVNKAKLALAASGALSPEEARQVAQHARECADCRRELEVWGAYARGLGQLPQPQIPLGLVARTQARVLRERADAADRRRSSLLFGALAVFAWVFNFAAWFLARALTGGVFEVLGTNLMNAAPWFLVSSMLTWITGAVAAVTLSRDGQRRFL